MLCESVYMIVLFNIAQDKYCFVFIPCHPMQIMLVNIQVA